MDEKTAIRSALAELEQRRLEIDALKLARKADKEYIATLEAIVAKQEKIIGKWAVAEAAGERESEALKRIEASYQRSVEAYDKALAKAQSDLNKANHRKWWYAIGGALVIEAINVLARR